ncbi:hypothetical protein LWI28_018963 [Acer negundo]|uniref:Uncharacterized protein n=1 Tax=Acer negundo TaxID=4023 RepID=A0AAD5JES4_ACENE|nr:hypothetical protein LWI28_018963 [Acer negundo]
MLASRISNIAIYVTLLCVTSSVAAGIPFPENDPTIVQTVLVPFKDFPEIPDLSADYPEISEPSADSPEPPETIFFPGEQLFDVTDYGAVADGNTDSSSAFLSAWDAACAHAENATLYIPEGEFLLGPVTFSGPCSNGKSPNVEIRGTLMAQPELDAFPDSNWIKFEQLNGINVAGGNEEAILDAQGGVEAWKQPSCSKSEKCEKLVTSLRFSNVSNGNISNIALLNGKGFHVVFQDCNNINIYKVNITAPGDSPNTDGIHASQSTEINITSSIIGVGDDCVSIGPGSVNISVFRISCGPGHGISVGSLGRNPNEKDVTGISVRNCTINGTQNGVRVKTWPGSTASKAFNFTFQDIIMSNVSNPIIIDQEYCPSHNCKTSEASLVKLSDIEFKNISGTYNSKSKVTLHCSTSVPCENIKFEDIHLNYTKKPEILGKFCSM